MFNYVNVNYFRSFSISFDFIEINKRKTNWSKNNYSLKTIDIKNNRLKKVFMIIK